MVMTTMGEPLAIVLIMTPAILLVALLVWMLLQHLRLLQILKEMRTLPDLLFEVRILTNRDYLRNAMYQPQVPPDPSRQGRFLPLRERAMRPPSDPMHGPTQPMPIVQPDIVTAPLPKLEKHVRR